MQTPKTLIAWSSGKDSAWALHELRQRDPVSVVGLLTTVGRDSGKIPMHGVHRALVEAQADAAGLPLWTVPIPEPDNQIQYERAMSDFVDRALGSGVELIAFGDLFLEGVREYRQSKLFGTGLRPIFPIWGRPTAPLARQMVSSGLRAVIASVDTHLLPRQALGQEFDGSFVDGLPGTADACGENGEFHTFVTDGPMFQHPVQVNVSIASPTERYAHANVFLANETFRTVEEEGVGLLNTWDLPVTESFLTELLHELFVVHWSQITFGPMVQGALWEMRMDRPPERFILHDGYLTIDLGNSHFHVCVGEHRGDERLPTPSRLAERRRTHRAEFFRRINRDGAPDTWGIRLFNGNDEQQLSVLLPNPFVSHSNRFREKPDWSQLELWNGLRLRFLGFAPDPFDQSGQRMLYP